MEQFLREFLISLLLGEKGTKTTTTTATTITFPPTQQQEGEVVKEKEKIDEGFELIKSLFSLNINGFGSAKSNPVKGNRNSIHIFPAKIAGKMNLKITLILHPINGLDWKDIDNAISLPGGIIPLIKKEFNIHPQKRVYVKIHDYGPECVNTWIPLFTDMMPTLTLVDSLFGDTLYSKDNSAIGFTEAINTGKVILTKNNTTFPEEVYRRMVDKIHGVTHRNDVILLDNEAVYTVSFNIPIKDDLQPISNLIEDKIYGYGAFKVNREDPELYLDHIYFHKSGRYEDGIFSSRIFLEGEEVKEEIINF